MDTKEKIKKMQQAEKYVLQGKISNAITAYRKIAAEFPADVLLLNTIGDLCLRNGNIAEAIKHFSQVAESYVKTGYTLKAIAVYKKVLNINPQNLEICGKLAELYAKQGLNAEAKNQYLFIANANSAKGMEKEAIFYYQKASELDPNDVAISIKLANVYIKQQDTQRAKVCYTNAGAALTKSKLYEDSARAFGKALELDPFDEAALRGLLDLGLATTKLPPAIEALEQADRQRPNHLAVMAMLGEAYLAAEREDEAERMFQQVLAADENQYQHFFTLGYHFYNKNNLEKAVEEISCISNILLSRRESDKLISFLKEILEIDANFLPALFKLAEVYYKINDEKESITILTKAVDIYIGQENYMEALNVMERLVHNDFHNQKFLRMHKEIFMEAYPDQAYHSPVPEPPAPESAKPAEPAAEAPAAPEPAPPVVEAAEEPSAIELDLSQDLEEIFSQKTEPMSEPQETHTWDDYETSGAPPGATEYAAPNQVLASSLQEIDFYIRLGFYSEAESRLAELEKRFPGEKGIYLRYRQIEEEKQKSGAGPATRKAASDQAYEEAPAQNGAFSSAERPEETAHTAPAPAPEAMAFEVPEEPVKSKYEIRPLEGIRPAPESEDNDKKPKQFAEVVEEVNKYVGEEKAEDFQTHFDLGVAYKEMGLLEDAIGEFQAAYRIAKALHLHTNVAHCCTILSSCFLEKGMPGSAVKWCKHGLTASGLSEDEVNALKYELANAYEKCGELKAAFDCLNEIYEMNINYRDIARKLSHLNELIDSKPS